MKKKSLVDLKKLNRTQIVDETALRQFKGGAEVIFSSVDPLNTNTVGSTLIWPDESDQTNDPDTQDDHVCFFILEC